MNTNTVGTPPGRRGPVEGEHVIGVDANRDRRPGVPMRGRFGDGAARDVIPRQDQPPEPLHREALDRPTPVYGTAQPPRGFSGAVRRAAYRVPEHRARHWMLLLFADRLDVVESRFGDLAARPLEAGGATGAARAVRKNPMPLLAGLVAGAWVAKRILAL